MFLRHVSLNSFYTCAYNLNSIIFYSVESLWVDCKSLRISFGWSKLFNSVMRYSLQFVPYNPRLLLFIYNALFTVLTYFWIIVLIQFFLNCNFLTISLVDIEIFIINGKHFLDVHRFILLICLPCERCVPLVWYQCKTPDRLIY